MDLKRQKNQKDIVLYHLYRGCKMGIAVQDIEATRAVLRGFLNEVVDKCGDARKKDLTLKNILDEWANATAVAIVRLDLLGQVKSKVA